jgi:hypothetical protein
VNKLRTTAIGIGLALTLAGCGGGGGSAPAAGLVSSTTTTVKLIPKQDLITAGDSACQTAGLTFADLRRKAADLAKGEPSDDAALDFMVNTAIPQWEKLVGQLRVAGTPNRDGRAFDKLNKTLDTALSQMKTETQKSPKDALADLADGPDKANSDPTRAGEVFANANQLAADFGFHNCGIF